MTATLHFTHKSFIEFDMKNDPLDEFLVEKPIKKRTKMDVFNWWEDKRARYNHYCIATWIISFIYVEYRFRLISTSDSSIYLYVGVSMFVIVNLYFFLGFFLEIMTSRNENIGPKLFAIITFGALFFITLPAIYTFFI